MYYNSGNEINKKKYGLPKTKKPHSLVSGIGLLEEKLPPSPKNPNFFVTVYIGMNYKKIGGRWTLVFVKC